MCQFSHCSHSRFLTSISPNLNFTFWSERRKYWVWIANDVHVSSWIIFSTKFHKKMLAAYSTTLIYFCQFSSAFLTFENMKRFSNTLKQSSKTDFSKRVLNAPLIIKLKDQMEEGEWRFSQKHQLVEKHVSQFSFLHFLSVRFNSSHKHDVSLLVFSKSSTTQTCGLCQLRISTTLTFALYTLSHASCTVH